MKAKSIQFLKTTSDKIHLIVLKKGDAWIDLNNNQKPDKGEELESQSEYHFDLTRKTVNVYGKITSLWCRYSNLTTLDLTQNSKLQTLDCSGNQLKSLDISKNIELYDLGCSYNKFTSLDLNKNLELVTLSCHNNKLITLDVSKNPKLQNLFCSNNQLEKLNIANGNNMNFSYFDALENPNLNCIQIDSNFEVPSNNLWKWKKDDIANWSQTPCL